MLQGLDEQQSVQLLQCYLQEDYRGTRDSLKVSFPILIIFFVYLYSLKSPFTSVSLKMYMVEARYVLAVFLDKVFWL